MKTCSPGAPDNMIPRVYITWISDGCLHNYIKADIYNDSLMSYSCLGQETSPSIYLSIGLKWIELNRKRSTKDNSLFLDNNVVNEIFI